MSTVEAPPTTTRVERSGWGRLVESQTSIDFVGRQKVGLVLSGLLLVVSVVSLIAQGLNLGIDFEGGVSWDVPAANFTIDDAEQVLADSGFSIEGARLQERQSESGDFIKVELGDQGPGVGEALRAALAEAAGVSPNDVNVNLVSSSWGSEITNKAIRALVIFLVIVAIFISIRFEWRMAIAAILAMVHDVAISVGIYSIFQFIVTPPTVIAFLTILGYSLYDTIVVFDRIRENEARFASQRPPYDDVVNISMNQVLMRSLATSFSSIVPVVSLLLIGAGVLGQGTLAEFALALLVGMVTGAYSSIFIAAPLLRLLKRTDESWKGRGDGRVTGEPLREMVMSGLMTGRRARIRVATGGSGTGFNADVPGETGDARGGPPVVDSVEHAKAALSHAPRPRKKQRR
jgi:preprotein translocase subunit SecF